MSDCQNPDHNSWLLNTVESASKDDGWTRSKRGAGIAMVGLGAYVATLFALAATVGPVPALLWVVVLVGALGVDRAVGKRQGGAR